jgi:hypothetical protein
VAGQAGRPVPAGRNGRSKIVVKGKTIAAYLTVTREVVKVERVEGLGAHFEIQALLDGELARQR